MQEPSSCTLAEFLIENEGKRCVVVLDVSVLQRWVGRGTDAVFQEIEKVEDQKALWSLLIPWELGSFFRVEFHVVPLMAWQVDVPWRLESVTSMRAMSFG